MSAYKYVRDAWRKPGDGLVRSLRTERLIRWRREPAVCPIEHPTRIDKARSLGYKAKPGVAMARVRVIRGPMNISRPNTGRRPKRMGIYGLTVNKSVRWIAEERAARKFPNMNVVGSYWVASDGRYAWYEVILADPSNPSVANDKDLSWVGNGAMRSRVFRGLTAAGRRARGLQR